MNDKSMSPLTPSHERDAKTSVGYAMLQVLLAVPAIALYLAWSTPMAGVLISIVAPLIFLLIVKGFYVLQRRPLTRGWSLRIQHRSILRREKRS